MPIKNIIFDFGGVLVDWNPRYLYREHFPNEADMEWFLKNICTDEWNIQQDNGRLLAEATQLLQQQFPEHYEMIGRFYGEWEKMLKDAIPGTVELLYKLRPHYQLYGLTNWSAETIDIAYRRFPFFAEFDGIVVSGVEKMIKPEHRFYKLLFERYGIKPKESVFIDDNEKNIVAAKEVGLHAIHFKNPEQLQVELEEMGVLFGGARGSW